MANSHRHASRSPRPAPEGFGRVKKKLQPGNNGTKRHQLRYGDDLVCVRYREDAENNVQYTTVEIIVDQRPLRKAPATAWQPGDDDLVGVSMDFQEGYLRRLGIEYGAQWNAKRQVWEMPYGTAVQLNLRKWVVPGNY